MMTEAELTEYQNYIYARLRKLNIYTENLDIEDNTITLFHLNSILDDIKHILSCIELRDKHTNNTLYNNKEGDNTYV